LRCTCSTGTTASQPRGNMRQSRFRCRCRDPPESRRIVGVRNGRGVRIRGVVPRTYYVGVDSAMPSIATRSNGG
jgi:hypothetical protein